MAGAGLREPPRAPRQPNMLRSLLFPVAAETKVTKNDKQKHVSSFNFENWF